MSACKLDVLAWLDSEIASREGVRSSGANAAGYSEAKEARAAVAELIAASQKALHHPSTDYNVRVDLRAALARVQP